MKLHGKTPTKLKKKLYGERESEKCYLGRARKKI